MNRRPVAVSCPDPARPSAIRAGVKRRRRASLSVTCELIASIWRIVRHHQAPIASISAMAGPIAAGAAFSSRRPSASARPIRCSQFSNSGAQSPTERLADIEDVVERQALIVQHDIVGAGNRDDEGDARRAQQRQQRIHVVLVGFGMIGVADVAAHRQAEQLAAEMVLQARPA